MPPAGGDGPVSPLCSRNARPQKALVGRAQWGTHPSHPGGNTHEEAWKDHLCSLAAALPVERRVLARRGWAGETSGLFEQPAGASGAVRGFLRSRIFPGPKWLMKIC